MFSYVFTICHLQMSIRKVSENAYMQYIKSRTNASVDSNRRVKEIEFSMCRIHPIFKNVVDDTEEERQTFIEKMKSYRPQGVSTITFLHNS